MCGLPKGVCYLIRHRLLTKHFKRYEWPRSCWAELRTSDWARLKVHIRKGKIVRTLLGGAHHVILAFDEAFEANPSSFLTFLLLLLLLQVQKPLAG